MSTSPDAAAIQYQLGLLQRELDDTELLLRVVSSREPDGIEIRAVGSVLQTFYNGIESILSLLLKAASPSTENWHQRLLEVAVEQRILSEELFVQLDPYRRFRHKFRHSYGFTLKWEMMAPLVQGIVPAFSAFKDSIRLRDL